MSERFSRFTNDEYRLFVRLISLRFFNGILSLSFSYGNVPQKIDFSFPLYISKFMEKADMDSNSFFLRWRNLDK